MEDVDFQNILKVLKLLRKVKKDSRYQIISLSGYFNNLYIFDRNIRMATMLSIVGAGWIGYELQSSFRMFEYQKVSAIIIIFITIF